jgi:hypothetical protein
MQHTIAINDLNMPSSLKLHLELELEIGDAMQRQALLEANLRSFELVLIDAATGSEEAYLFVTAGIGKYAKHICDSWTCNFVTAGIGILLQLTYLYDI